MLAYLTTHSGRHRSAAGALAVLLGCAISAMAAEPDPLVSPWLGREMRVGTTNMNDHLPLNGRLTFVYDADDDVVRVCTRSIPALRATWRMDLAVPCNVALNFIRGSRYCSRQEVNTGDAEVLATCHRLRSRDVAMHPAAQKDAVELHDMIVFLIKGAEGDRPSAYVLLDSPAHLTHAGGGDIVPQ
jgi:hypothetical protein